MEFGGPVDVEIKVRGLWVKEHAKRYVRIFNTTRK